VVSVHPEGELAIQALRAGAAGYVTKTEAPTDLMAAVAKVHAGGRYVSPRLAERLAEALTAGPPGQAHRALSPREYPALCWSGCGWRACCVTCGTWNRCSKPRRWPRRGWCSPTPSLTWS